jgi:hypothetical protein
MKNNEEIFVILKKIELRLKQLECQHDGEVETDFLGYILTCKLCEKTLGCYIDEIKLIEAKIKHDREVLNRNELKALETIEFLKKRNPTSILG